MRNNLKGYYYALLSALLFGASIPVTKYFLVVVDPWILASLLYLGSALGLSVVFIFRKFVLKTKAYSKIKSNVWKWVAVSSILGGIIGPALLLCGLSKTSASTASLLLSFENVFTVVVAWLIFKEKTDKRTTFGICLIILGSVVLAFNNSLNFNNLLGLSLITVACLCWAFEHNIIRKIATEDPVILALIKSLVAGVTNTLLGLMVGGAFPSQLKIIVEVGFVGMISYAVSMLFFISALRYIGAMKTGACCAFTPLVGVCLAVLWLGEPVPLQLIIAGLLMTAGILLHFF